MWRPTSLACGCIYVVVDPYVHKEVYERRGHQGAQEKEVEERVPEHPEEGREGGARIRPALRGEGDYLLVPGSVPGLVPHQVGR